MALTKERKEELVKEYGRGNNDTGSVEVQVAILTEEIKELTEHLKEHKHDFHSKRGLLQKVGKRKSLLEYLKIPRLLQHRQLILTDRDHIRVKGSDVGCLGYGIGEEAGRQSLLGKSTHLDLGFYRGIAG